MLTHGVTFNNTPQEHFQIHLNIERIRVPEIIYQPSIIGIDQGGLSQTFKQILSQFKYEEELELVKVFFFLYFSNKGE